ncbi:MAG: hypothetical protein LBB56_05595 [Chitinispirillales bacterium]|jgi:hypothetical protein|nr:hypothetical protein [Chitinispirillales bacterium]
MKTSRRFYFNFMTVFIIVLLPFLAAAPRVAGICENFGSTVYAQKKGLLTKDYVDTTVMRALYILNEAQSFSGMNTKQDDAIIQAKQVLSRLKQQAKGDPNEKYALWKISEIEYQINLEEEEVRRIAADKRLMTSNQLVLQYNGEVGKMRPDFAMLRGLYRRMMEVDTRQGNNLADSYNKRYRQISRDAMASLEKAVNANDLILAKKELEYCEKNKNFLMISDSRLAGHKERIEKIENSKMEAQRISAELDAGESAAREFRLSESRANLTMAKSRVTAIKDILPPKDAAALSARADKALRGLDNREDSLVNVVMSVLNTQGHEAAIEYFQDVLQKRMNISNERASIIDQTILRTGTVKTADNGPAIVEDYTSNEPDKYHLLTDMQKTAKVRAQVRADSIKALTAQISINIYMLLDKNKAKDASQLFAKERQFLSSSLPKSSFETLQSSVTGTSGTNEKFDKNRQKAHIVSGLIYALIENNKTNEAYQRFQRNQKPLSRHMDREAFQMLELTVTQSYNSHSR